MAAVTSQIIATETDAKPSNNSIQEEALLKLPPNALHVALWIRSDPPIQDDFHWAFYLHKSAVGGIKHDAESQGAGWFTQHEQQGNILKSTFLCVLIQIATVPEELHDRLDQIMRSRDTDLNDIANVNCVVWLRVILEKLIEQGLVPCSNAQELMNECKVIGNGFAVDASTNLQPRPVVHSKLCK